MRVSEQNRSEPLGNASFRSETAGESKDLDFGGINRVTEVASVPQGDIRAKQLRLSGHRYVHVFDFAAGIYGIAVHPDSQPYITFFVEGRGYFAYVRMPFGVTGGPSEFGHVTGDSD